MTVAVYSNARTTVSAQIPGFTACFNTAFRAGSIMGFALNGLGILVLYFLLCVYKVDSDRIECLLYFLLLLLTILHLPLHSPTMKSRETG